MPIVTTPGPRGVGKTTMRFQIIRDLLDDGVQPHHIIRVPLDQVRVIEGMLDPILRSFSHNPPKTASTSHRVRTASPIVRGRWGVGLLTGLATWPRFIICG